MYQLPETGYVPIHVIIGRDAITESQAQANRMRQDQAIADEQAKNKGKKKIKNYRKPYTGPLRPRDAITPIIPVKKSTWYAGIKSGRFPQPVKIGAKTLWRVEDIRALIEKGSV